MMPAGLPMPSTPPTPPAASTPNAAARGAQSNDRDSKPFAGMLDEATPSEPAPADTAPAKAEAEPAESADKATDDAANAALPDQLLALLGGVWAVTPATPAAANSPAPAASGDPLLAGNAAPALPTLNLLPALPGTPTATVAPTLPTAPTAAAPNAMANAAASGNTGFALPGLLAMSASSNAAAPQADAAAFAALAGFQPGLDARVERAGDALTDASRDLGVDGLNFNPASAAPGVTLTPRAVAMLDAVTLPTNPDVGFGDDLGTRIGWMVDQKLGEAQIRVHPEHVGPIDVRVQLDGQRVTAEFNSANADVRHALEAGLGRLRDMLSQQGLQLAHAGVGQGQREGQGSGHASTGTGAPDTTGNGDDAPRLRISRGLLDEYA